MVAEEVERHMNKEGMTTMEILNKNRETQSEIAGMIPPIRESKYGIRIGDQFKVVLTRKLLLTIRDKRQVLTKFGAALFQVGW